MSKLKLAYVSPFLPLKTGIANYSATLILYLAERYDIELIVSQENIENNLSKISFPIRSDEWFKLNYQHYDRVLYHFGNSRFHTYMINLLKSIPGVIVLHDFYLSGALSNEYTLNSNILYHLHGYTALSYLQETSMAEVTSKYPCNKEIVENALGVIVHSDYSKKLADRYYYKPSLDNWYKIPLLREHPQKQDIFGKEDLDLPKDAFVVSSFGMLGANKLNIKLLDAWINSSLSLDPDAYLIFVGENDTSEYGQILQKKINHYKNIKITGWIDTKTFDSYLAISDIAVQLRTSSRGETSAAALDTMNFSIATIVNENGSMSELPQDTLFMLKDDFQTSELTEALERLYKDRSLRNTLSQKAAEYIRTYHDPAYCAHLYYKAIENGYTTKQWYEQHAIKELSNHIQNIPQLVETLSLSYFDSIAQRQILVDISSIIQEDLKTGIQRVVRSQLIQLIKNAPENYRIEPVYFKEDENAYFYARSYTTTLLHLKDVDTLYDEPVHLNSHDIFYGLDLNAKELSICTQTRLYEKYRSLGVKFYFVVYDLLPVLTPHFFPPYMQETHTHWLQNIIKVADGLICISETVANQLSLWIQTDPRERDSTPKISFRS
ncbi:MAG: glycosyltransferase, partial [Thiovulaceae bacterium]|nr:glycosyltransferase [Sulfurimonadaceae bacterium]